MTYLKSINFHSLILAGVKLLAITGINSVTCVGVLEAMCLQGFCYMRKIM